MAKDDWFRNKRWNEAIETSFFEKLSRARSQGDQYLAIQALTLAKHDPHATLRLVDHYFRTRKMEFHDIQALSARARAYRALGKQAEAINAYKSILAREAEHPSHKTTTYVEFPYFVAIEQIESAYDLAVDVLETRKGDIAFPLDRFMWHAAYALIALRRDDRSLAKEHAQQALTAAGRTKSDFRYHQHVGLVGKEHQAVIDELSRLA